MVMVSLCFGCGKSNSEVSYSENNVNDVTEIIHKDETEADYTTETTEDIEVLFNGITDEMLSACDSYPASEAYWNDSLILLNEYSNDVRLYGISSGDKQAMILYVSGEKLLIEYPFRNLYEEKQKLNVDDIDNDGMDEVIISSRIYTGSVKRYALWVCDYEDKWNVYMYENYLNDITNTIYYDYNENYNKITFLDSDNNVLWEGSLPEWTDDYPYMGTVNFENNMEFDAEMMRLEVIPQIELENSLPYEPIRIIFDIGFSNGDFEISNFDIQIINKK